jgi:hypothetical protein
MDFLNHLISILPAPSAPVVATIALVAEFAMRLIPSEKPLGLIHGAAALVRGAGTLLGKLADLSDAVFPQKLS